MGCGKSKQADIPLEPEQKVMKILLVGAGDSGKSTIFKQMRILYKQGYTDQELQNHRPVVYENILRAMMALVKASVALNIPIEKEENKERAKQINEFDQRVLTNVKSVWNDELAKNISELWNDAGIQKTYDQRSEFQIDDSAPYYFSNLDRICQPNYVPTVDDVVRSRVKTTGINETDFAFSNINFSMVDVGGQRNERKKWIHCFEDVHAIIFVSSLSEFDQRCYEDDQTNRMNESLKLFDEYCNSHWFSNTLVYLMMNKSDIFDQKIRAGKDLKKAFPDWQGGEAEAAREFVKKKYQEKDREGKLRQIYYTNAVNRDALKVELDNIVQHIMQNAKDKPKSATPGNQSFRVNNGSMSSRKV